MDHAKLGDSRSRPPRIGAHLHAGRRGEQYARLAVALIAVGAVAQTADSRGAPWQSGDVRWARSIVLKRTDLGPSDASPPGNGKTCLPGKLPSQTAFARSWLFTKGDEIVSSRAWIFGRPGGARSGFRRLVALDYARCLERLGAGGAQILLATQDHFAGHESTTESYCGIRVSLSLSQGPLLFDVFVDVLVVREGRALAAIAFTSAKAPPDQSFESTTLKKMSARMRTHH